MMSNFTRSVIAKWLLPAKALALALALTIPAGQVSAQSTTPPSGYCSTQHSGMGNNGCANGWGFHLLKVGLNGWQHDFTCVTNTVYRYWNNFGSVTTLSQGATYTLTTQTASTTYNTSAGAWIDWNQDGQFSNTEYVGPNAVGGGAPTFNNQFTVPCSAASGNTILRVRCDYNSALGANYGCNNTYNGYGETVDYIITISSSSSPSANFSMPDSIYVNSPASFINSNQVGYVSHAWDILNVGSNPDANSVNYTTTFPSTGNYQMRLSSTNCQGTASTTKNFTVIAPTSSPVANFVSSQNSVVYDGSSPIYIDFFDLSSFGPTSWEWVMDPDANNGAPYAWLGSEYDQNPTGFFFDVENYNVCLIVTNSVGADTLCRNKYIEIMSPTAGPGAFENWLGQQQSSDLDSGTIYDSGGPNGNTKDNEYYTFTINPCGATSITLSFFGAFDVEACCDDVFIYDGPDVSYPLIANYNGTTTPGSVTATSGALTIEWISDVSVVGSGFNATWSAEIAQNGPPVASFDMPDSVFMCSSGNDIQFVNTSAGVVPGQASYDWIFDFDPNVTYPSNYADAYDEDSPMWSYYADGTYNVRMVLHSCEGEDTAYGSFVLATTTAVPTVDFTNTERILKVGGTTLLTSTTLGGCDYEWDIFPTSYSIENGGTVNDPQILVKFNSPGSYSVKLTSTNDVGSAFEEKTNLIDVIDYCKPNTQYSSVADVGITRVIVNDIDNETSAGVSPGYQDYTDDFSTNLTIGQTYDYTVERATNVNGVNRKIWIDYNRDGDFADANEEVASETAATTKVFTGNFVIPSLVDGVIPGETRMRVGIGLTNTSLTACGPNQVGEYEDYTVIIETDDEAPVITMIGGDTVIQKNTTFVDPGATAMDNLEGNITSRIIADNGVNLTQAGVYYITYDVSDLSGNPAPTTVRRVTVVEDLTAPSIVLNGNNPLLWSVLVPYVDPGATATDMPSGSNISNLITVTNPVMVNAIGDFTVEYTVIDNYGNEAMATRLVQVRDTTRPVIVANATMPIQVGTAFVDPVTASDNFDMNVMPVVVKGMVDANVVGEYDVEYSVVDASGNVGQNMTVTFEVADYIAPVIHYTPGTETIVVDVFDYNWATKPGMSVSASDNYYNHADLTLDPGGFNIDEIGTYTLTYTAEDEAGNSVVFVRTVIVADREMPTVVTNPLNLERWNTNFDLKTGVVVIDNYYSPVDFAGSGQNGCFVEIIRSNVDVHYPGIYQVVYKATDGSGNESVETTRLVMVSESAISGLNGDFANAVKVYPNPSAGQFVVEISTAVESASIQITNSVGVLVQEINVADMVNGRFDIDLGSVASGVYFVKVKSGANTAIQKIIIQ